MVKIGVPRVGSVCDCQQYTLDSVACLSPLASAVLNQAPMTPTYTRRFVSQEGSTAVAVPGLFRSLPQLVTE